MQRKWNVLAALTAVFVLTAGFLKADDDKESPLGKVMEKINTKNNLIKKATKTAVQFKKSGKDVVKHAEALAKLAKEAKDMSKDGVKNVDKEKYKNPVEEWNRLSDDLILASEKLAQEAEKGELAGTKSALGAVSKSCSACHAIFRKDED